MQHDVRPVVAGVSAEDGVVLSAAVDAARRLHAPLQVVHAYVVPPSRMGEAYGIDIPGSFQAGAEDLLAATIARLDPHLDVEITAFVERGETVGVLRRLSRRAGLLVVGSDQPRWSAVLTGGHVAARLTRHVACPMLIVPRDASGSADAGPGDVMVIVEAGVQADAILRRALDEAALRSGRLRVVHLIDDGSAVRRGIAKAELTRDVDWWSRDLEGVTTSVEVVDGLSVDEVIDGVRDVSCVVLGCDALDAPGGIVSMRRRLLDHTRTPLLLVPPDRSAIVHDRAEGMAAS